VIQVSVSQVLRDEWKRQILKILNAIEEEMLAHPAIVARKAELETAYNAEHANTLALVVETEILASQIKDLGARKDKILHELEEAAHLGVHSYRSSQAREVYEALKKKAVLKSLNEAIETHPALAEEYARYREVRDNLDLTLLLAHTPTKLKEAMVRLCKSLGVDLPAV
jgi:hypothetical protein